MTTGRDTAIWVAVITALGGIIAAAVQSGALFSPDDDGPAQEEVAVVSPTVGPLVTDPRPPDVPRVETSVFLDRDSGPAGTTVVVSGEGFLPSERVELLVHTDTVGRTRANASGRFSGVSVVIPSSLAVFAPQAFSVVAQGEQSLRSARAQFTVSG